jgi:hypothetical protein
VNEIVQEPDSGSRTHSRTLCHWRVERGREGNTQRLLRGEPRSICQSPRCRWSTGPPEPAVGQLCRQDEPAPDREDGTDLFDEDLDAVRAFAVARGGNRRSSKIAPGGAKPVI